MSEPDVALINGMQNSVSLRSGLCGQASVLSGLIGAVSILRRCAPQATLFCRAHGKIKTEIPFDNSYLFQTLF